MNADNITSGTLDNERLPGEMNADTLDDLDSTDFAMMVHTHDDRYYTKTLANDTYLNLTGGTLTGDLSLSSLYASGVINGDGSGLMNLNASRLTTGTIDSTRLPSINANTLEGLDSTAFAMVAHTHDERYYLKSEVDANFLGLNGGNLTGDLYLSSLYANGVINGDGGGLTNLNASNITIGSIDSARLPTNIDADTVDGADVGTSEGDIGLLGSDGRFNISMIPTGFVRMKTGTYAGNGQATQSITDVGFQPKYMIAWRKVTNHVEYMKTDQDGLYTQHEKFYFTDLIISFDADGFTVGDASEGGGNNPNENALVYTYVAFG
jgi:hypothetical protein